MPGSGHSVISQVRPSGYWMVTLGLGGVSYAQIRQDSLPVVSPLKILYREFPERSASFAADDSGPGPTKEVVSC